MKKNYSAIIRRSLSVLREATAQEIAEYTGEDAQAISKSCSKMYYKCYLKRRRAQPIITYPKGVRIEKPVWKYCLNLSEEEKTKLKPSLVLGPKWGYLPGRGIVR